MAPTALIAEDEALLAAHLKSELSRLWPELTIVASVDHGEAAVQQALSLRPDLLFLDIRMPGMSGLEAAQALAEDWPDEAQQPFPLIVFVTAYDQYALQAFERAAVDYVLKPVQSERLAQTCARLQAALRQRETPQGAPASLDVVMQQLRGLIVGAPVPPPAQLRVIQAGAGTAIHFVPVDEVLYFEAADKYVRVITAEGEHLIRTALRELQPQLDPQRFWQIHRGTIVRCDAIASVLRDEAGKLTLTLRGHPDRLTVSRMYAHLFKAM
ncbi:LytTR family DNA-binding domain-containing protein [Piscinibacter sp. XHJ-5]|uniref:LytR/AlgR family response regulator transcription factor n=1 Tax=Piscinibacter sp. XHJ-5 TaxID=3037797 RepID=UPI002452BC9F|nr:LytTR family DNA-binding domain-containing protein [Piscinibacter sp. XHJ-5]